RHYGLDKDFKLNIEANHATLAGHTFEHELRVSRLNNMLGSIDANQGDPILGWDTDEFPFDVYTATMAMYEVLKSKGLTGGFNFDAKNRRGSYTHEDMFYGYILGMDTYALGLINADKLIRDGRIEKMIKEKYASFNTGIGKKIVSDKTSLEELSKYACKLKDAKLPKSNHQELMQSIVNQIIHSK
ncbi:MAG: xylose isomerase, partial [Bacilli bacterium]|nr:xylose isomerase [Bacilli bacterium]